MTEEVTMPLTLTPQMIRAVRENPSTSVQDWDEWHTRLGWLICAWDVLVAHRPVAGAELPKTLDDQLRRQARQVREAVYESYHRPAP